jgi:Asp-tRNA(Asn)/Glu-tRNA(Gln) amidotransferase A subunit family amidase
MQWALDWFQLLWDVVRSNVSSIESQAKLTSSKDGGGSIRIPSSYCGIFGLKTTHSRVSGRPTPNLAGTNTVSGPMCIDMSSLEVAYRVMATPDPEATHSSQFPYPRPHSAPRRKVIGIYQHWFDRADAPVKQAAQDAIDYYRTELGYEVIDISIPLINEGQTAHALTIMNEGVNGNPLPRDWLQPANRILMAVAANCTANDFLQAQRVRMLLMQHLAHLFALTPDLIIVMPTTPNAGCVIDSAADLKTGISDGDMTTRSMEFIYLANFTGCPALTLPVGFLEPKKGKGKIPVGLMGMSIWGSEDLLIEWGYEGEKYLNEKLEGSRIKSPVWADVLGEALKADTKSTETSDDIVKDTANGSTAVEQTTKDDAKPAEEDVANGTKV